MQCFTFKLKSGWADAQPGREARPERHFQARRCLLRRRQLQGHSARSCTGPSRRASRSVEGRRALSRRAPDRAAPRNLRAWLQLRSTAATGRCPQ
eukprot:361643-Chlamydomonas_euryale.AAC.4